MTPNESEVLMKAMMDAASKFYLSRGEVQGGKPRIDPFQMLNAIAAIAGVTLGTAPSGVLEDAVKKFAEDVATHAGFSANVSLKRMQ